MNVKGETPPTPEGRPDACPFCRAPVEGDGPVCRRCGFEFGTDWQPPEGKEGAAFEPGLRVCSSCGARNPVGRDFCSECNAPVGDYTAAKPLEHIGAIGHLVRTEAGELARTSPAFRAFRTAVGGVFLLFALLSLAPTAFRGLNAVRDGFWRFDLPEAIDAGLGLLIGGVFAYVGWHLVRPGPATPRWLTFARARRDEPPAPEDGADPEVAPESSPLVMLIMVVLIMALLGLFAATLLWY